jgi:hypothetical protein
MIDTSNNLRCELPTVVLRGESRTADKIRLKEIEENALGGNQRVVLLNLFFYFFNPFFVARLSLKQ